MSVSRLFGLRDKVEYLGNEDNCCEGISDESKSRIEICG